MNWLLFLSQVPSQPSSLRVYVWRKLKAAGALGLQNGVWILPDTPEQRAFLESLLASVQEQGATGQIFTVTALAPAIEADIQERFRADRDEEYVEFIERSHVLLRELETETAKEKFTFAELEENEPDLERLSDWLEKIMARDFLTANKQAEAVALLKTCQSAFETFAAEIYRRQSMDDL